MPRPPSGPRLINGKYWAVKTVKGKKLSKCLGSNQAQAQREWPRVWAALGQEQTRLYHPEELITVTTPDGVETHRAMDLLDPGSLTFDPFAEAQPVADAWENAFEAARRRHLRRQHKQLSSSWEAQVRVIKTYLPRMFYLKT